jgi:hypothetical protein
MRNIFLLGFVLLSFGCYKSGRGTPGDSGTDPAADPTFDPAADPATDPADQNCPGGIYFREEITATQYVAVDILVVMDNSGSMAAEQQMLADAFPDLIRSILTGQDSSGSQVHAPVRDLHMGVVSTDLGIGGYNVQTCENDPLVGDDGVLQHEPHGTGCAPAYPPYLSYYIEPTADPSMEIIDQLSHDFGCISMLGTSGCGFEQQLEAAYKALVVHCQPGGANAGFLRENSILVVFFVTDVEDCSAADPTIFDITALPYSASLQCFYQAAKLHDVERYIQAFRQLRPDPRDLVVGFITGVPQDAECIGSGDAIDRCLDMPEMQEVVRPDGELLEYTCIFPPDCTPPDPPYPGDCTAETFPGRRFVQLAQALGSSSVVHSLCTDTFVPAVSALTDKLRASVIARTPSPPSEILPLPVTKNPVDPCICVAPCIIVETLSDSRPCPDYDGDGVPNIYDQDGDRVGDIFMDPVTGIPRSLCEIPQAGSIIENCELACDHPEAGLTRDPGFPAGWWYNPWGIQGVDQNGDTVPDLGPVLNFEGVEPDSGSTLTIECCF